MNEARVKAAIEAVVMTDFDSCTTAFRERPSATNWEALQVAMWARQGISSPDTLAKAVERLPAIGVARWPETIKSIHEGKQP